MSKSTETREVLAGGLMILPLLMLELVSLAVGVFVLSAMLTVPLVIAFLVAERLSSYRKLIPWVVAFGVNFVTLWATGALDILRAAWSVL